MTKRCTMQSCLLTLLAMLGISAAQGDELQAGQPAPPFALKDQAGNTHRLSDYAGKWLVVYFYPKDDTPGCTKEACHFRDDIATLHDLGVQLLGISLDSTESHEQFAAKFKLPFPLLADDGGAVAKRYDAYWSFLFIHVARRHTFIIDPSGHIAKIYREVDPDTHSAQVIADIKQLQQHARGS
jgi:peroxiredoxin Q/BCP